MAPRDPLSSSGRPVDVKQHGLEAQGASRASSSTSLSLGSKRPVPYMDEPYADTSRR
jgi:hypothetical protein